MVDKAEDTPVEPPPAEQVLSLVRQQFGANAQAYGTSPVHVRGASLGRLVDVLALEPTWSVLDVATGGGSVALACAPHVQRVVASDVTPEMLEVVSQRAAEAGLSNVDTELANAHDLPYEADSWDAVTCRIAPHHFHDPAAFVSEVARVLRPGGLFGLVDNVVPDDESVAAFANQWEQKRDPSHVRCLSVDEWLGLLVANGFEVQHRELLSKEMGFAWWCDNMSVPEDVRAELLDELRNADASVHDFLRPRFAEPVTHESTVFHLTEVLLVAAAHKATTAAEV